MTAQAGAVAYTFQGEVFLAKHWTADTPPAGWSPLYTTTPAAVPVEALEGLVKIMGEFLDAEWTPELDTIQQWRDELTQLIKERSNG